MQERAYFQAYNPTALKFTLLSVIWERLCDQHSALLNGIFPAEQPRRCWAAQGGVSCVPSALSPCPCSTGGGAPSQGTSPCFNSSPGSIPSTQEQEQPYPWASFLPSSPGWSVVKVTSLQPPVSQSWPPQPLTSLSHQGDVWERSRALPRYTTSLAATVRDEIPDRLQRCPLPSMQNRPGRALQLFCRMYTGKMISVPFLLVFNCS